MRKIDINNKCVPNVSPGEARADAAAANSPIGAAPSPPRERPPLHVPAPSGRPAASNGTSLFAHLEHLIADIYKTIIINLNLWIMLIYKLQASHVSS